MKKPDQSGLQYPQGLRAWDLEPHYSIHVGALTTEDLHSKADIAIQLAWRDKQIESLRQRLRAAGYPAP